MADETILLKIEIEGTEEEIAEIGRVRKQIEETRHSILALKKAQKERGADVGAELAKEEIKMKILRDTYRELRGVVQSATEAQIKGARTLGTMKAELMKLKADLDDVAIGTREWTNQAANIRRLTDEISIAEQKTGDFRRNVGNYSGDIQRAFAAMGISTGKFGQTIMFLTTSQSGLTQKTLLFARSLSTVQKALLATGIGGFIVLLGVLIANWEKIINLFKSATDRAREYAEQQRKIYEKFQEEGKLIDENIRRLELLGAKEEEIALIKQQRLTEEQAALDKVLNAEKELLRLEMLKPSMDKLTLAGKILLYTVTLGQLKKVSRNLEEIETLEKSINELETQRLKISNDILDIQVKTRKTLSDAAAEDLKNAKAARAEASKKYNEEVEFLQKILELETKSADKAIARADATVKSEAARRAGLDAQQFGFEEEGQVTESDSPFARGIQSALLSEYDAVQEMNNNIVLSYQDRFTAIAALEAQGVITAEQSAERRMFLEKEVALSKLSAYAAALSTIGDMVGKETGLAKAAAIAATLINTYVAAQAAAKNPPGPPYTTPFVVAAVASGLANLMKIRSVKTSFARGVIGLQGVGTETSDSINARLSRGESVLTAKATKRYAPQLAAMELSVGNQPNYQLGSRRFASGIIAAGMGAGDTTTAQRRMVTDIMSELRAIKVYVVEKDITATQGRARKVNVMGDI